MIPRSRRYPRQAAFLDRFEASQLEKLLWYLERVTAEPGDRLVSEGDLDQSLFIGVRGCFEVVAKGRLLRRLEAGHVFGEIAFLASTPRSASVVATEESEVLCMTKARFEEMRHRDAD